MRHNILHQLVPLKLRPCVSDGMAKFGYRNEFVNDDELVAMKAGNGTAPVEDKDAPVAVGHVGFLMACVIGGIISMVTFAPY
eukprot:COSAG01_NODE_23937_length_796_cov_1.512195_1_plen_81_part_10